MGCPMRYFIVMSPEEVEGKTVVHGCHCPGDRVRTLFRTKNSRNFQGLSRTHFPFFKDSIWCKKEPWVSLFCFFHNMSNFTLIGLSVSAPFRHLKCTLAPKFKDFPAPTAIFKDFQGPEFLFWNSRTFKNFQGACKPWRDMALHKCKALAIICVAQRCVKLPSFSHGRL